MADPLTTPARREGLRILAKYGKARRSNFTAEHTPQLGWPYIYWQTADWLVKQELAEATDWDRLAITPKGRRFAARIAEQEESE